jgi:undecaprenyl pyrophosphate phosphatase UppP
MLAAAVSGYFSIRLLRYVASKSSFGGFSYYCWGAGIVAVLLSLVA